MELVLVVILLFIYVKLFVFVISYALRTLISVVFYVILLSSTFYFEIIDNIEFVLLVIYVSYYVSFVWISVIYVFIVFTFVVFYV